MIRILILLAVLFAIGACEAFACDAPILPQPAQVQPAAPQYVTIYGPPKPIYATPIRTSIWRAVQPRAYYQPATQVRVATPCPHCRRPQ